MKFDQWKNFVGSFLIIFTSGCATNEQKIATETGEAKSAVEVVEQVSEIVKRQEAPLPKYPADCRKFERAGLMPIDNQEEIIFKYDSALSRGNSRIARCAAFYDSISSSRKAIQQ